MCSTPQKQPAPKVASSVVMSSLPRMIVPSPSSQLHGAPFHRPAPFRWRHPSEVVVRPGTLEMVHLADTPAGGRYPISGSGRDTRAEEEGPMRPWELIGITDTVEWTP